MSLHHSERQQDGNRRERRGWEEYLPRRWGKRTALHVREPHGRHLLRPGAEDDEWPEEAIHLEEEHQRPERRQPGSNQRQHYFVPDLELACTAHTGAVQHIVDDSLVDVLSHEEYRNRMVEGRKQRSGVRIDESQRVDEVEQRNRDELERYGQRDQRQIEQGLSTGERELCKRVATRRAEKNCTDSTEHCVDETVEERSEEQRMRMEDGLGVVRHEMASR